MDNKKLILYLLGAFVLYKMFVSKEGFALSSDIIDDPSKLEAGVLYMKGYRKTSNTTKPATNGGQACSEFPDVVYKRMPSQAAVCKTSNITNDNVDGNYIFETDPKLGSDFKKLAGFKTTPWLAVKASANPDMYMARRLFQGRLQCLSMNGADCLWRDTLAAAQADAANPPPNAAPSGVDYQVYYDINNKSIPAEQWRTITAANKLTDAELMI